MRLAGLLRVSSSEDYEEKGWGSIEVQREKIEKWADVHDHEIVAWYPDDDVSGMIPLPDRPHAGRLLREASTQGFEGVVVYRLDRVGRCFKVIFDGLDAFEQLGLQFLSATENFDTVTPSGRAMLGMLATFAGFERDTLLQRTTDGKIKWAKVGCWLGGILPYGYTLTEIEDRKFLVPSVEVLDGCRMSESGVIAQIYEWVTEDRLSSWQIARRLIALGVPTHSHLPAKRPGVKRKVVSRGNWQPSKIRAMIANPTYKGLHIFGGKKGQKLPAHPRAVAPIISEETWATAQQQMDRNRDRGGRPAETPYLLKGLIVCSHCRCKYIGTKWPFGKRTAEGKHYYKCGGKHAAYSVGTEYLKERNCRNRALQGNELEAAVWEDVLWIVSHADEVAASVQDKQPTNEAALDRLQDHLDTCDHRLEDLDNQARTLVNLRVRGRLTDELFDAEQDRIDAEKLATLREKEELAGERANLQEARVDQEGFRQALEELAFVVATEEAPVELKRYAIRRMVKRIEVDAPTTPGRSANPEPIIKVVWRADQAKLARTYGSWFEFCLDLGVARRAA
jgi:site-specific DNA recombinase